MSVTQKPSRRRWLWLIPGGFVLVGVVVFFAWWQYFKTTPAYALALLIEASQQNDRAAFDRMVDLDRVIDNFIGQRPEGSAIGVTTPMVTSVRVQLESLAPETIAAIKENVKERIRNRINEVAGPAGARPFLVTALAMPFVTEMSRTDQSAEIRINRAAELELTMERREGSDWQVTAVRDQALASRVVSEIVKQLPQSEPEFDKQLGKELRTLPQKLPLPLP
ncbi:MAG TPA: hypothetical protein DC047_14340 [Blastocatellia bacterium]|nr:hypothetical protein [Blastocatellia bacterium]